MELSSVEYFRLLDRLADYFDRDGKVISAPLVRESFAEVDHIVVGEGKPWLND